MQPVLHARDRIFHLKCLCCDQKNVNWPIITWGLNRERQVELRGSSGRWGGEAEAEMARQAAARPLSQQQRAAAPVGCPEAAEGAGSQDVSGDHSSRDESIHQRNERIPLT